MHARLNLLVQNYEQLKQSLKWKVSDDKVLMTVSSIYVINNQTFDLQRLLDLANAIKSQAGLFSPLRSQARFTTAAMLDVKFNQPEEKIQELFNLYNDFREERFVRGIYTYISAMILLVMDVEDNKSIISRAKDIYDGMTKEHMFLTSNSDYPLATLLALENRPDMITHIESFYEELSKNGFRKGNDLQFLSHILALGNMERNRLISQVLQITDRFKENNMKVKSLYYPLIGMLSLLPIDSISIEQIADTYHELNQMKGFKWQKDMNFILSASLYISDKLENEGLAETSLTILLESLMQAQQAAMIAATSGSTGGSN